MMPRPLRQCPRITLSDDNPMKAGWQLGGRGGRDVPYGWGGGAQPVQQDP